MNKYHPDYKCTNEINLEAERDRFKQEIKDIEANTVSAYSYAHELDLKDKEIDRLKAELSERNKLEDCLKINEDRDLWKSKAERLAEALSKIAHFDGGMPGKVRGYAEEALEEYENLGE